MTRVTIVHECGVSVGGAERYVELLAEGLPQRGVAPSVVLTGAHGPAIDRLAARLGTVGPRQRTTGLLVPGWLWSAVRTTDPDLIHWNLREPFAFRGCGLTMLPWHRPAVATDHLPMLRSGPHWELVRRWANRRFDGVIVVGPSARAAATQRWPRPPRLFVVRNGVKRPARLRRARPRGAPVVLLFLGRLAGQKNPLYAVEVLDATRRGGLDARLKVVGEGELRPAMERLVAERGLEDHVEFVGVLDDPGAQLAEADVLIAPSTREGAPFAPLEALAHGVPVVASDIPPHRELPVSPGVLTLVPLVDPGAWGPAVAALLAAETPPAVIAEAASPFSAETMVQGTVDVYRSVLGTSSSGPLGSA